MKKHLSLLAIAVLLLTGCQYFGQKPAAQTNPAGSEGQASTTATVTVGDQKTELPATDSPDQISTTASSGALADNSDNGAPQYSIYLIALNDQGLNGKEVGCGDSVVPLVENSTKSAATNTELLNEAFNNLLSIKDKTLPQSAFSNFLAGSKLKLVSAEIKDGKAIVKLSGQLSLAGECDDPRVKAQLQETAAQFDDVKSVEIYLNNKTLEQATSLKG